MAIDTPRLCGTFAIAVALSLLACVALAAEPADPFPELATSYLLLLNDKPLWAHKPAHRVAPASLTKLMTALIVLEKSKPDDIVTVSATAARETGKRLGLRQGERFTVADLLTAALLLSANDASRALADHIGGNEANFVTMMNRRAAELGLQNTRFSNASGHDHPGLYSTAQDLARLATTLFAHPFSARLGKTVRTSITSSDGRRTFRFENKNELLGRFAGTINGKTGTTGRAGKCLIALVERNGSRVMLVLLGSVERWWNAEAMLEQAFAYVGNADRSRKP